MFREKLNSQFRSRTFVPLFWWHEIKIILQWLGKLMNEQNSSFFTSPTDRSDFTYPPMIESILNLSEPNADFLAPGDRVHQVDGISTIGLTNEQVMNLLLHNRDENAVIEIEYSLPDYRKMTKYDFNSTIYLSLWWCVVLTFVVSQNSLCVTTKLAQVIIERENGCLGLTLRGGSEMPIIVTSVRPFGPAYKTSRIKPGDRVLRVDNVSFLVNC